MKNNSWVSYKNGNYTVRLNLENGTKIRENDLDYFEANTVESMDIKITNCCDMGCKYCHENSIPDGKHADLFAPSFLDALHPYTELAIGGGNPLSHPDLLKFLVRCKENKWIPSMTVNQVHFEQNFEFIKQLVNAKLIYGLGISLIDANDNFISKVQEIPNAVIHVIAGIHNIPKLDRLSNKGLKILILGYKQVRRGSDLYTKFSSAIQEDIKSLKNSLPSIVKEDWFKVISFDNLALNQLDVKNTLNIDDEDWKFMYMGDDGMCTLFIDMVERTFSRNSCEINDRKPLMNTVEEMLKNI